jgi:uracil phosphoribosyltransferase
MSFDPSRLIVIDHPLVDHKLSVIRNKHTPSATFRQATQELARIELVEATRHIKTHEVEIDTPVAHTTGRSYEGNEPVIVPILRAGLAFEHAALDLIPTASVAHLGMCRDEETHEAIEYYAKMPHDIASRQVIVVDPMLATGGSLVAAIDRLRARGVKDLVCMVLVAAPEGVERVLAHDPDVRIFTCSLDEGLNENAYIVPGLGDAGDRVFGTLDAETVVLR